MYTISNRPIEEQLHHDNECTSSTTGRELDQNRLDSELESKEAEISQNV